MNTKEEFYSNVRKTDSCWIWEKSKNQYGYGICWFHKKLQAAHRVAYFLEIGEIPVGKYILHSCDNPPCVRYHHLKPGTQKENIADSSLKGRMHQGEDHILSKLLKNDVIWIRNNYKKGLGKIFAKKFNVHSTTITSIITGRRWGNTH